MDQSKKSYVFLQLPSIHRFPDQFVYERWKLVDPLQRFQDRARINGNRAPLLIRIQIVPTQGLNVTVKENSNKLSVSIDNRASAAAADTIRRRDAGEGR